MSRATRLRLSASMLVMGAAASAIGLGAQVIAWATTACQMPNPSTVFCTENHQTHPCDDSYYGSESLCNVNWQALERNQFPDGPVSASSGTTKEVTADCWRIKVCRWDADASKCKSDTEWRPWHPGDKTATGDNQCPTEE